MLSTAYLLQKHHNLLGYGSAFMVGLLQYPNSQCRDKHTAEGLDMRACGSNVLPVDVDVQRDFFSESSPSALRALFASWSLPECKRWCGLCACNLHIIVGTLHTHFWQSDINLVM